MAAVLAVAVALVSSHRVVGADPPQQDQCKPVNATEPSQCPATIGPPCPPCYTNLADEYHPGDNVSFDAADQAKLHDFTEWYLGWWGDNYPPAKVSEGYNLFLGSAGRGNVFLRAYLDGGSANATLLLTAEQYINKSIDLLPRKQEHASYLYGHIGVWFLKAVVDIVKGDTASVASYQALITSTIGNAADAIREKKTTTADGLSLQDCTLATGVSGMLHGALLYNAYFGKDLVPPADIAALAFHILDMGIATGKEQKQEILMYESWANCYLWGPARGITGAIKSIFLAYEKYPDVLADLFTPGSDYYVWLKRTLDYFVTIQLPDGNMPTALAGGCARFDGNDDDAKVQWCHGAPGFISVYLEASVLFAKLAPESATQYFTAGVSTANTTWSRGLLVKGTMFCHGIGGNINMLLEASSFLRKLGQTELADVMLWRAKQFTLWTLDWGNLHATRLTQSDRGYSMFQGNYAIPMVYTTLLRAPSNSPACQPGWNLCV